MLSRDAAANRAVPATFAMILAHMVMNRGGNAKQNGAAGMGHGKGRQARHGKAVVTNSRQMKWAAQASKQTASR